MKRILADDVPKCAPGTVISAEDARELGVISLFVVGRKVGTDGEYMRTELFPVSFDTEVYAGDVWKTAWNGKPFPQAFPALHSYPLESSRYDDAANTYWEISPEDVDVLIGILVEANRERRKAEQPERGTYGKI